MRNVIGTDRDGEEEVASGKDDEEAHMREERERRAGKELVFDGICWFTATKLGATRGTV